MNLEYFPKNKLQNRKAKKLSVVYCNTSFTLSAASWKRIAE